MSERTFGNSYTIALSSISVGSTPTALQTNEDFEGVVVYIPITSVSGWSSNSDNLNAALQWSPDGGTTWFTLNQVSPAQSVGPTDPLFLATGPNASFGNGNNNANYGTVLPRTWRILFTIQSGSSAVYTMSDAYVEYL